jgi:ribosomal-protein-alanine N-acetyltransferase
MPVNIRPYTASDFDACMTIFDSNCPLYFDELERDLFAKWLQHQSASAGFESPTYADAAYDAYFVAENEHEQVLACAGFYIVKEQPEARLAWGMVHANCHKQGFGTALYQFRKNKIKQDWPLHQITLGTSQHTYLFYEKMGMSVQQIIPQGYGASLDRIDMLEP